MASSLFTPILNDRTRAPNFFNGRLLTGEAMTDEQRAQRTANELLAQAVGDGVAYGLEVSPGPTTVNTADHPVVSVKSGVAINRRGEILYLGNDTHVELVRPTDPVPEPNKIFRACVPVTTGTYIADAGVYLLTVSSIRAGNGLTQVSGLGDTPAGCNVKYVVDAVEFRLLELPVDNASLGDVARLRNLVAYQCFGVNDLPDFATDPFATATEPHTLLDDIRGTTLTNCDVPLAILYWTATGGIQWIDLWAVRRRVTTAMTASPSLLDDTRLAVSEAMREQFRMHLGTIATSTTYSAMTNFRWLPPAGLVPLSSSSGAAGFDVQNFFDGKTWNRHITWPSPVYMEGGMVESLLRESSRHPPVDLEDEEMIWLYSVRENMRALHTGQTVQPYVVFANANLPYYGEARIHRAHVNYANFV
ncbi:MAG TPA: hypothetical protein VEK57_28865 [Thermoanaerobaculia bacterium]|nr:hypothetical protein [Thermoanaerobaculia bacterium]